MASYARGTMTGTAVSANGIQELVLDAVDSRTPLRISGRSHWMNAGRAVDASRIVSLATHHGVVDYVPGDLTITVKSGTTLHEIDTITRAEGQWLPLDPFGSGDGTIGATIATGSSGPLAHGFGRARDLVLGVEFITGEGKVVRGGGRVVKNVAGFDLVRLITGSWGTLGIITELTLRLYSRPPSSATLLLSVPGGASALAQRISAVSASPVMPLAMELVSAAVASEMGIAPAAVLAVELGGNAASVAAQRDSLAKLGGVSEAASPWHKLRLIEGDTPRTVLRFSSLPERIAAMWTALLDATRELDGAMMHAAPGLGLVRLILPADTSAERIGAIMAAVPGATVIHERMPHSMWDTFSPSIVSDRISQGIMRAFDPHRILNPGIMGPAT